MDRLKAYYMLSRVQPPYFRTRTPYQGTHNRRIHYNLKELELHFNETLGIYYPRREREDRRPPNPDWKKAKHGGCENRIIVLEL